MTTSTPVQTSYTWNTKIISKGMGSGGTNRYVETLAPWGGTIPLKSWTRALDLLEPFKDGQDIALSVTRGNLKQDKMGDAPWEYFWNISHITKAGANWEDPKSQTPDPIPQPMPDPIPQPIPDPRAKQIAWNSAVDNAVHLLTLAEYQEWFIGRDMTHSEKIKFLASEVYEIIMDGPPSEIPLEGPEMDVEGPWDEEVTDTIPVSEDPVLYINQTVGKYTQKTGKEILPSRLLAYIRQHYEVDPTLQNISHCLQQMSIGDKLSLGSAILEGRVQ